MEAFLKRGATLKVEVRHNRKVAKFCISVTESQLIEYVEYLIDNIFIQVSDKVCKKVVGIPMGTVCVPLLANLFLFHYDL